MRLIGSLRADKGDGMACQRLVWRRLSQTAKRGCVVDSGASSRSTAKHAAGVALRVERARSDAHATTLWSSALGPAEDMCMSCAGAHAL